MKEIWDYLKKIMLIGAIPIGAFWLAVLLAFWLYPDNVDGAANLLMIMTGGGCLVAIALVIRNLIEGVKDVMENGH